MSWSQRPTGSVFRGCHKVEKQTFVEFSIEKEILFNIWCTSQKVETKEQLQQLIILGEFRICVPEVVSTYFRECLSWRRLPCLLMSSFWIIKYFLVINLVKLRAMLRLALLAIELAAMVLVLQFSLQSLLVLAFFCCCKKPGHVIANCHALSKKQKVAKCHRLGLMVSAPCQLPSEENGSSPSIKDSDEHDSFAPFCIDGSVAISESEKPVPIRIVRDTGAAQSWLLGRVLPLSEKTATDCSALVQGCGMTWLLAPLHVVYFHFI